MNLPTSVSEEKIKEGITKTQSLHDDQIKVIDKFGPRERHYQYTSVGPHV